MGFAQFSLSRACSLRAGPLISDPVALYQQCALAPEVVAIKVKTAELFQTKGSIVKTSLIRHEKPVPQNYLHVLL